MKEKQNLDLQLKRDIEDFINNAMAAVAMSIKWASERNTPLVFDSGSFGEGLVCILDDAKGSGTQGGLSFDSDAGHETKTLFYMQSKKCKACGHKNSFFSHSCHGSGCNSQQFKYASDTRAGIDCKAHKEYYNRLSEYMIVEIIPTEQSASCRNAKIKMWRIKKDNPFFNSVLDVQREAGRNKTHKNLLTSSVEFKMSCPSLCMEADVDFSDKWYLKSKVTTLNTKYEENTVGGIPPSEFKRQYKEYQLKAQRFTTDGLYDPIANKAGVIAKAGSHGKSRGNTKRSNVTLF